MKRKMKKRTKIILIVILSLAVILIACFVPIVLRLSYLMTPTKGEQIPGYQNTKSALLVIDVQNDTLNNSKYKNTDTIMKNINNTITYANENGMSVIYIKQEYKDNFLDSILSFGTYQAGSEGSQLSDQLQLKPEIMFTKIKSDAFSSMKFENYLKGEQIDTLYLVGADASACVYATAIGGTNRGYHVKILKDAIFAGSEDIMNTMVKQYKRNGIEVISVESFIK